MIGFELAIQNEKMTAALEEGVVSVIFSRIKTGERDEIHLGVSGLNLKNQENHQWISRKLRLGEEIIVKVVGLENPSDPVSIEHYPIEKALLEDKLMRYQNLKKELEEAGLI